MAHHHHGHHHGHGHHGHHHAKPNSSKLLWIAVLITFLFALVEAITGYFSHSLALLSDAGHMLADALSLILAAVAAWVASHPPSKKHSYGLARAEVIGGLLSSLLVFIVVVVIAVEAVKRLQDPEPVQGGSVMIIGALGVIVNLVIAFILSAGQKTLNMRAALLHVIGDMLGSVAAIISGAVILYTDWLPIDPILSVFICLLIVLSSLRLLREAFLVLMESVPSHIQLENVGRSMATIPKVRQVHDLHIWTVGSGMIMLTAHITIKDMNDWANILTQLKQLLHDKFAIEHITLQPEISEQIIHPMPFKK